ncbi:ketopantoate reductase family protein [Stetteria hydrogenophila]
MAHVCIVGPGAVGATLACSAGKLPVTVIGKRAERVEVHGLCPGYSFTTLSWSDVVGECLAVFICVKAHQTPSLTGWLSRLHSPLFLVVQNGFYGLEIVERTVERGLVAGGVAEFGAARRLNRVEVRGPGRLIVGCRGRDCRGELQILSAMLEAPIRVETVSDIEPWRWLKAIVNSVVNTITTIRGIPNGEILADEETARLALDLAAELSGIAESMGVIMPEDPYRYLERIVRETSENISSTLQDLMYCRVPEIGWIVHPFLDRSRLLAKLFREVVNAFQSRCGVDVPLPPPSPPGWSAVL